MKYRCVTLGDKQDGVRLILPPDSQLRRITRDQFVAAIDDNPANKFAKTFVAKADMLDRWGNCIGLVQSSTGRVMGAVLMTVSKRAPYIANLQLLHTFSDFRRMGVAKSLMFVSLILCEEDYLHFAPEGWNAPEYFRVSSEPEAVPFYESLGFRFLGKQKSGSHLCIFRFVAREGVPERHAGYAACDKVISAAVNKKGKGGVVEVSPFWETLQAEEATEPSIIEEICRND